MARFAIHSADGQSIRYTGCPTYNGTYLKPSFLEFREIASPSPIDWQVGDYVDYTSDDKCTRTGYRYKLYDIPQPTKKAAVGEYEGAIVYQNVQFFAPTKDLELCPFRDIVLADNTIHFSTRDDVSTFEPLSGIIARLQANLDDWYGEDVWDIRIADGLPDELVAAINEPREFSVAGGSVLDAINKCYDIFDNIGWRFSVEDDVNVLTFGAANVTPDATNTTPTMKYGFASDGSRNGLNTIGKAQSNKDEFATRLYAYGSSRNMNFQYYRSDAEIKDAESLDIEHLMIPKRYWGKTDGQYDARKAFLANQAVELAWGKRAKYHYFDGSEDDEIYPSLEGVTIGLIREVKEEMEDTEYVPSETIYPDEDERVDYPKSVVNPADDGVYNTGTSEDIKKGTLNDGITASWFSTWGAGTNWSHTMPTNFGTIELPLVSADYRVTLGAGYGGVVSWDSGRFAQDIFYVNLIVKRTRIVGGTASEETIGNIPLTIGRGYLDFTFELSDSRTYELITGGEGVTRDYLSFEIQAGTTGVLPVSDIRMSLSITNHEISYTLKKFFAEDFTLTLKQIGFSINDRQALGSNGLATVFFNEGMCAGRGFVVKSCEYQSATDDWKLVCTRAYDESTGMAYPNDSYKITTSDRFVLLDIAMPDLYIKVAEERLYARASALLTDISRIKPTYSPSIDAQMLSGSPFAIEEGMFMALQDTDVTGGAVEKIIIDSITISEGEASIPTYKVTLREEKGKTFRNGLNSGAVSSTPLTSAKIGEGSGASMNVSGGLASLTVGSVSAVLATSQWVLGRGFAMASDIPTALSQLSDDATHRLVTDTQIEAWANAALYAHSHSNKSVLDGITSAKVTAWDGAVTKAHEHSNKTALDLIRYDATNNVVYIGDENNHINFAAYGDISAGGIGQGGGGGGGGIASLLLNGATILPDTDGKANLGYLTTTTDFNGLQTRVAALENTTPHVAFGTAGADYIPLTVNSVTKNLLTAHQSLEAYRTATNQDTIDNAIKGRLTTIEGLIPSAATTSNQLADKAFVNSSISTATATFRGTSASGLTESQFLAWANGLTKDNNDYVFWNTTDSAGNVQFKRYKYNGTSWVYEYTLNNSSFTAAQWAAINSGLTSSDKTALDNALALIATYGNIVTHNVSEFATAEQGAKADSAYQKPSTGIPNTDLANSSITIAGSATSLGGSISADTIVGAATSAATFAGTAAKATQLATARNIWGQSFNGTSAISGDMSSVGKMTFTAKTSAATSGNVLEVVTIDGVTYLHTTLPFYSDSDISAGSVGSGGGGGDGIRLIKVNGTSAPITAEGVSEIGGLVASLSAHNTLAGRVSVLEGKATAVSYTPTVTSGTALGTITIDGTGHTIYAPTIPTALSQFTNDSGYITGITSSMVTTALGYTPVNKAGDTITGVLYPSSDSAIDFGSATRKWHYGYFHRLLRLTSITTSDVYSTNTITIPAKAGTMALISDIPTTYVTSLGGKSGAIGTGTGVEVTSASVLTLTSTYQTYISHGETAYNSLGNYQPLATAINTANIGNQSVAYATYVKSPYSYPFNVMTNSITSETLFGNNDSLNILSCGFMESQPTWGSYADVLYFTGYTKWGGTQIATQYDAINPRVAIRKFNQSRAGWGDWTEFYTTANLTASVITSALGSTYVQNANYASSAGNADTLDGQHGSYYATASSLSNYLPLSGGTMTGGITASGSIESTDGSIVISHNVYSTGGLVGDLIFTGHAGAERLSRSGRIRYYASFYGIYQRLEVVSINYNNETVLASIDAGGNLVVTGSISAANGYINGNTIYHSGNANNTSTPWTCSNLTASGNAIISGNVGIGTTSPSEKLHIVGNVLTTGNILRTTTGQSIGTSAAPWGEIHANKWYPNANDTTNYIEYTGTGFLIHGNVAATGDVTAGA